MWSVYVISVCLKLRPPAIYNPSVCEEHPIRETLAQREGNLSSNNLTGGIGAAAKISVR